MIGILCPANDLPALWAYQGLKRRGLSSLEIITTEALVYNRRLEHRLGDDYTITGITLADGRVLYGAEYHSILNRINALPIEHFRNASPADRQYAAQEQQAVFLSWLHGLPGVLINRPGARGLCGDLPSPAEWIWLAGCVGLPTLPFKQCDSQVPQDYAGAGNSTSQVIVLDSQVFGQPKTLKQLSLQSSQESFRLSIARLAELSRLRLMGIGFYFTSSGEPRFASATPLPDLRLGGEALLDALVEALA